MVDFMPFTVIFDAKNAGPTMATDFMVTRTLNGQPVGQPVAQQIVNPSNEHHELWHTQGNVAAPIQWAKGFGAGVNADRIKRYGGYVQGANDEWSKKVEPRLEAAEKQAMASDLDYFRAAQTAVVAGFKQDADSITEAGLFHDQNQVYLTGLAPATQPF
jgi:hypothetical protein